MDPVESATGYQQRLPEDKGEPFPPRESAAGQAVKKKAGFYLSAQILERFNLKFHELKLAGAAIENKSALLELVLSFALDDLDKGGKSAILKSIDK